MNPKDRLVVALDVPTADQAQALVDRLAGHVGMFKVGSQLFTAAGPDFVRRLIGRGERVFLDLKFHDIPATVGRAAEAACRLGVNLLDVHALAGRAAIEAAARATAGTDTRLLAITILTSHDQRTLEELGIAGAVPDAVRRLAALAQSSGAHGVVASPQEVALVRAAAGAGFLVVTPGIRPAGAALADQVRVATPSSAIAQGADLIVVGRPITEAADPAAAADAIVAEMMPR